jgi:two-component system, NarL family, nitrate/nitrite response regulator NarL
MPPARTRIIVADDHPLYLEGVVGAIRERPEFELVGQAGDGLQALALIREAQPDVAVIDLRLPQLDGIGVLQDVKASMQQTKVLILSWVTTSAVVYDAIERGADGYASKTATRADICDAIAIVARGESYLSPELGAGIANQIRLRSNAEPQLLSGREHQVLAFMADGLKVHEVAKQLNLSVSTVKTHQEHLYEKLGVSSAAAAVAEAMRRGLLA